MSRRPMRRLPKVATALLLVIQALSGGAVTLAHAAERSTAPAAIEAQHDARCVVLHDAVRCAVCQHAGVQVVISHAATHAVAATVVAHRPVAALATLAHAPSFPAAAPRAPPADSRS